MENSISKKEVTAMIDIYTEKKDAKDWIIQNDLYFNLNTSNEEMSEKEVEVIKQADDAILTPDKHIQTKYGLGTIRNLSSGCKTLLNIMKHPEKVVCVEECGPNVLKMIFQMDNIKIYMSRPSFTEIPDNADILINDDIRKFINFEFSNQYMLFLRNCDGLNVSEKSFKILKLEDNKISLEEEV